jgi:signal transduction histidine kinase
VVIHIAGTLDDIAESTRVLAASLLVIAPVVAALLAVLVWSLVKRTLRPVEAIRAEVAAIGGADLERRVTVPPGDDEISGLARTMNGMLERVSTSVDRQRRFVADASHELRSPLTRIRSELEVDLAHPQVADPLATHRSVLEETVGLQRLVDDLLLLARSDANVPAPTVDEPVDLDDIVVRVARRAREEAPVAVEVTEVRALRTRGDARQLARAVANLADNAVRHATSRITLTLARQGDFAVLAVADDGPGIPADQRDRVFERFARLDEARPRATGGTGLGLAIAREIVEHHGGTLTIDGEHRPGVRFVVALPIDPDDR